MPISQSQRSFALPVTILAATSLLSLNAPAHADRNGLPPTTLDSFVDNFGLKKVDPKTAQKAREKVLKSLPMPLFEMKKTEDVILQPSTAFDEVILDAVVYVDSDAKPEAIEKFYLDWFKKNDWAFWRDEQGSFPTYQVFEARNKENVKHKWTLSIDGRTEYIPHRYTIEFRKSTELDVVGKSRILCHAFVGEGGEEPYEFACYRHLLLNGKKHWSDFVKMLETGTPAGRVYAAVLLYSTDKTKATPLIEPMLKDTTTLPTQSGCLIFDTTVQKEIERLLKKGDIFDSY